MRLRVVLIMVGLLVLTTACGRSEPSNGPQLVVASFYPLAFAGQEIAGPRFAVEDLTRPGVEPHDLEVSPIDASTIQEADLVLLLGHGFQPQIEDAVSGANVLRLLDTPGLDLLPNGDPHVWLDPLRYAKIVTRIGQALKREAAARRLNARLRQLDGEYRRGLANCERRELVTSHEAFAYLAQRYGLEQIPITGLSPEAEPRPADLARVIQLVKERGVTTVYYETLVSPRIAETVARETGATTAALDPIEGLTKDEAKRGGDYFTLMRANLQALEKGLGCR